MEMLLTISGMLLLTSIIGYIMSVIKESMDIKNHRVKINSDKLTQNEIDEVDYKVFLLGKKRLNIGDELKVYTLNDSSVKGTLLGIKRHNNSLCMLTKGDEVIELNLKSIVKLKVVTKYGRL